MARYFFNVRNGQGLTPDEEGRELADVEAARVAALADARSMLSAEVMDGRLDLGGRIEIEDADHNPVLTVDFREAVSLEETQLPPEGDK